MGGCGCVFCVSTGGSAVAQRIAWASRRIYCWTREFAPSPHKSRVYTWRACVRRGRPARLTSGSGRFNFPFTWLVLCRCWEKYELRWSRYRHREDRPLESACCQTSHASHWSVTGRVMIPFGGAFCFPLKRLFIRCNFRGGRSVLILKI
jgi:hypothetical protein